MKSLKNRESKRDGLLFLPSTDLCGSPTPTCRTHGRVSKVVADQDDLTQSRYCTRAIISRSQFEAALFYKPRILSLENEEFPFLVHKLSAI